jgi:hypothetical protein
MVLKKVWKKAEVPKLKTPEAFKDRKENQFKRLKQSQFRKNINNRKVSV